MEHSSLVTKFVQFKLRNTQEWLDWQPVALASLGSPGQWKRVPYLVRARVGTHITYRSRARGDVYSSYMLRITLPLGVTLAWSDTIDANAQLRKGWTLEW